MNAVPAPLGVVAHYNLLERLEPSGPGDLFRARDTHRGRTVTIRLLQGDFAPRPESRSGLIAEARACIALSHPNVATLFDAGEQQERVYLAFEHLRGRALRAEMAGRPMNVRRALEIAIQISDAVAHVHAAGLQHRGLSPDSVVITEKGHAKIPAFYLASQIGFDPAKGDLDLHDCEAPEEARGERVDDRADVYSAGAIAYEMLTARRPPHRGASAPSAWNARVPKELDAVMLKALAPNPASRYQSAAALAGDLRAIGPMLDGNAAAGDEVDPPGEPATRARPWFATAAVVLILALVAVWWLTRS